MPDRPRDLYDTLQRLSILTTPDIQAQNEVLDVFQAPTGDDLALADAVKLPNLHHGGAYYWNVAPIRWNLFQWSAGPSPTGVPTRYAK